MTGIWIIIFVHIVMFKINSWFFKNLVLPPKITAPKNVIADISKPTSLACYGEGTFGLNIEWENNPGNIELQNNRNYLTKLNKLYDLSIKLTDLHKYYKCQIENPHFVECVRNFTCKGFYSIKRDVVAKTTTTVIVKVCTYSLLFSCLL